MNSALISTFLWTLFLFCCPDPAWTTRAEDTALLEMETKMTNMMDRMERMEADMEAKNKMISSLGDSMDNFKVEMETKDQRIATLECKLKTKEEEMTSLKGRMTEAEKTDFKMRDMMDQVRNPPFAFQCAWQDAWNHDNSIITYDRLTYDDISGGTIFNVTGGMDISTGVFTVGHGFSGVWSVSFSIGSNLQGGQWNPAYLYLNGRRIEESYHDASNWNSANVASLGSRTLYMRLEEGDQVTLRTGTIYNLHYITVCFELSQFDYNPNP